MMGAVKLLNLSAYCHVDASSSFIIASEVDLSRSGILRELDGRTRSHQSVPILPTQAKNLKSLMLLALLYPQFAMIM